MDFRLLKTFHSTSKRYVRASWSQRSRKIFFDENHCRTSETDLRNNTFQRSGHRQNPDYIKQNLGFLPQDFGVYPKVSAYDLLEHYIAILKGINDKTNVKTRFWVCWKKSTFLILLEKKFIPFLGNETAIQCCSGLIREIRRSSL